MKKICSVIIVSIMLITLTFNASAISETVPYNNYTYSAENKIITSPQAYMPTKVIYGHNYNIGDFKSATDIDCDSNGNLYILDEGSNRVVILDSAFNLKKIYTLNSNITLNQAKGITVANNQIIICDTDNSRLIILDANNGNYIKTVLQPKSNAFSDDFLFKPTKVSVDKDGNYYIVSNGTFEGVINLDSNGSFLTFFAANAATASSWDLFWRRFSTIEQRKNSIQFVPQDLSSIDMDDAGFFFVTSNTPQNGSMLKRANPGGKDVIRNISGNDIIGDIKDAATGNNTKASSFTDVSAGRYKICACLDATRGKIFCYSSDGYLLYTFGALADQVGGFVAPTALTYLNDDKIAVLDSRINSITVFEPTDYAKNINKGLDYNNNLDYNNALKQWQKVITYNQNYELAQNMIARSYFDEGNYKKSLKNFRDSGNKAMYSTVKESLRTNWISNNIRYVLGILILLLIFIFIFKKIRKKKSHVKRVIK